MSPKMRGEGLTDGPMTPQRLLALAPAGLRRGPAMGERGYNHWRAARVAWYEAAGISALHLIRAETFGGALAGQRCPWILPAPTQVPDPTDPRWSAWLHQSDAERVHQTEERDDRDRP